MTNITTAQHRRSGISSLIVTLIIVGVGAGMTFAALGGIQDNLGSMTGSNRIAIESVNAYTDGDRMVITGNVKNLGSQALTSITIDEITAGDLVITQRNDISDGQIAAGHGAMTLVGLDKDGDPTTPVGDVEVGATPAAGTTASVWTGSGLNNRFEFLVAATHGVATVSVTGLSTDDDAANRERLGAGSSKSFRIVIMGDSTNANDHILDILRTVPASTDLYITIAGTDGQVSTISDPRSARVTQR